MSAVVVVGSCMVDFCSYAPRLPAAGETLRGHKYVLGYGGKGANQCVSACKLGATATLVARLGDDSFGLDYLQALRQCGVNTDYVKVTKGCCSGMAQITVADTGENHIVIVPGANMQLTVEDVEEARHVIEKAKVLVFQLETPLQTTLEAMRLSNGRGKCVVNGAPALVDADPLLYQLLDVLVVNETEAEVMGGVPVQSVSAAGRATQEFLRKGCKAIVITLGPEGAVFATSSAPVPVHVPTRKVKPVDTTGAGDAFVGAMAYYMAYHPQLALQEIVRRSCLIASTSVGVEGTQASFPCHTDLPQDLF